MANELVVKGASVDLAQLNKKVNNQLYAIQIKTKNCKTKDGKKKFKSVKALKYMRTYDIEGKDLGMKNRWLDVHFTMDAFNDVPVECDIHKQDDLATGTLYVLGTCVQSPRVYKPEQAVDDKGDLEWNSDGTAKIAYPCLWIKGGIKGFIPYVEDAEAFEYHPEAIDVELDEEEYEVDEETGEIITDESESVSDEIVIE